MPSTTAPERARTGLRIDGLSVVPRRRNSDVTRPILAIDDLALPPGALVAVTGPSGAGKSTLLGVLSGIVSPTIGRVVWDGKDLAGLPESARDRWRRHNVGFVFQDFHLVSELSALENVLMPARFDRFAVPRSIRERAVSLLARVDVPDTRRRAGLLSRGEQQRTALARALLTEPRILLADEPTASLDEENGRTVADLLLASAAETGATLVVASHDAALVRRLPLRWRMTSGRVECDEVAT